MKLKEHVTSEMLAKYFNDEHIRIQHNGIIIHVPEALNAEYDIWFNLETREIEDFGLYGDGIIQDLIEKGWVEE